ncbi:carbohydrate-binding protein [Clostridium beijerinckii]|nr:carbohydrate-binding protein [Clostridium beijerinckii]NOV63485.1 hypothetical protein [Clostridium beijerinckii]NOV69549.1 hypothetical protein [Clostridium beijerinckii]NOW31542.1 hypothetical protein [Clostridium beijerinckii]
MSLNKVRVQLLDENTGTVLQEVDVLTSADAVTFSDGQTFQQKLDNGALKGDAGATGATGAQGATGATGTRGSQWYSGTAITGTSTTATIFSSSGITSALAGDQYLNTSTGYVYNCTVSGNAATAKWVYSGSIKGATGNDGATGATGAKGNTGVSMVLKNAWVSGTAYVNNSTQIDIVTYNGSSYACKTSHTASASILPTNTTYWTCIAQKGDAGATGTQGPAGADGASVKYGTDYATGTEVKLFFKTI